MNYTSDFPGSSAERPSPRREILGPRPTPLKVNKDSHKIAKKPPVAPPQPKPLPPPHHRPPVIIYTVSPKVIHTNPSDFMSLVQRLTGASSSSSNSSSDPTNRPLPSPPAAGGTLSPAARLAAIEKTARPSDSDQWKAGSDVLSHLGIDGGASALDRPSTFPAGILSPMPSSLPAISPGIFSPSVDPNSLSFLHEMSPAFHGNRSYVENAFFVNSPGNNLFSATANPSPGAYWDLFNQYQDF